MPLNALLDNEPVIASLLDEDEWQALKDAVKAKSLQVYMPCCGGEAYLRTSYYGFNHFVHKSRGNCGARSESWERLKAKDIIAKACQAVGYRVEMTLTGSKWWSGVLATRGSVKIAFEIQFSLYHLIEIEQRQQRYDRSGIRTCWFMKTVPEDYELQKSLPLFQLTLDEQQATIAFAPEGDYRSEYLQHIPLSEFVTALLTKKLRFCASLRAMRQQTITVYFATETCYRCQQDYEVYFVETLKTGCGNWIDPLGLWSDEKIYLAPEIQQAVRQYALTPAGKHLRIGHIKKRYSKALEREYLSFGCAYCDAICGDFYLMKLYEAALNGEDYVQLGVTFQNPPSIPHKHWCYSEAGHFCCE